MTKQKKPVQVNEGTGLTPELLVDQIVTLMIQTYPDRFSETHRGWLKERMTEDISEHVAERDDEIVNVDMGIVCPQCFTTMIDGKCSDCRCSNCEDSIQQLIKRGRPKPDDVTQELWDRIKTETYQGITLGKGGKGKTGTTSGGVGKGPMGPATDSPPQFSHDADKKPRCKRCQGTGHEPFKGVEKCDHCGGTGVVNNA